MKMNDEQTPGTTGSLRIERRYAAPVERVWKAWTEPGQMQRWMCAPSQEPAQEPIQADVRVGGTFRIPMVEDGHPIAAVGEYLEVQEPVRLVLTWSWEADIPMETRDSRVEITLARDGEATQLVLIHSGFRSREACQAHREGWTIALEALEERFAK